MKKIIALAGALSLALLAACSPTPGPSTVDRSTSLQSALDTVQTAYAVATLAAAAYSVLPSCGTPGATALCAEPAITAQIAKAEAVLDVAMARAKAEILAAPDQSTAATAMRLALDAIAVFGKVMQTYGVKSG
jgi:hypothetical protein